MYLNSLALVASVPRIHCFFEYDCAFPDLVTTGHVLEHENACVLRTAHQKYVSEADYRERCSYSSITCTKLKCHEQIKEIQRLRCGDSQPAISWNLCTFKQKNLSHIQTLSHVRSGASERRRGITIWTFDCLAIVLCKVHREIARSRLNRRGR